METLEHLKETLWTTPDSYLGFEPQGHYTVYATHRGGYIMDDVNMHTMWERLRREAMFAGDPGSVYKWSASHWAVGRIEYLMVKPDAPASVLAMAEEFLAALSGYPCLDDDTYSEWQFDAVFSYWASESLEERVDYCTEYDVTPFAARRDDDIPGAVLDGLLDSEMFY